MQIIRMIHGCFNARRVAGFPRRAAALAENMTTTKITNGKRAQKLRMELQLRQDEFWSRVGVTQSAGSRYETGSRRLPVPLQMLIELAYGSKSLEALKRLRG